MADVHLGTLARYLRLLGFDTRYGNDLDDAELARLTSRERRILLTRDVGLLKRKTVVRGQWLRSREPERQVEAARRRTASETRDSSVHPLHDVQRSPDGASRGWTSPGSCRRACIADSARSGSAATAGASIGGARTFIRLQRLVPRARAPRNEAARPRRNLLMLRRMRHVDLHAPHDTSGAIRD